MLDQSCFAARGEDCAALTAGRCENCGFYKTQATYIRENEQALRRIKGLPEKVQATIAKTYYGGELPKEDRNDI